MKKENSYYMKVDDVKIFDGVDIKHLIQEMFPDYEVWVEHDAKVCALAEWNELGKTWTASRNRCCVLSAESVSAAES